MPTESYGEFGLNGIAVGDGADVLGPLQPARVGNRESSLEIRIPSTLQEQAAQGRLDKIDFEFILTA